jgi:zeaxanthin glucosyltransferase
VSRYLFVVPPLTGHVYPAVAVADAVAALGHEVAWVGTEPFLRPLVGAEATVYGTGMRPYRGQRDRGLRAIRSLWDGFVLPYARFTLPSVCRAVTAYRPDVVVSDQHALAGALAAARHGVPWATLAPQSMELVRPLSTTYPRIEEWIGARLAALVAEAGLGPGFDPRFSPDLILVFSCPALIGPVPVPPNVALVGAVVGARRGEAPVRPLPPDPARRTVLVTMGTLAPDLARDFYPRVLAALAPLSERVRAVVVAPPEAVPDPPPHVRVTPRVPLPAMLSTVDAVVCHAGMNTVAEALCHGVPLVLAPIRHDQPMNAAHVAAAGAGIRVSFSRVRPEALHAALTAVLDEPGYRGAAARLGGALAAAGGAAEAARRLAALTPPPARGAQAATPTP